MPLSNGGPRFSKAAEQVARKGAQRIIARTHDDDPVPSAGECDDAVAAILTRGEMLGPLPDRLDNALTADRAVYCPAEIGRVAEKKAVIRRHPFAERPREFAAHLLEGSVSMRLEEKEQASGKGMKRIQGRGDLVRIMPEIVNDGDVAR